MGGKTIIREYINIFGLNNEKNIENNKNSFK